MSKEPLDLLKSVLSDSSPSERQTQRFSFGTGKQAEAGLAIPKSDIIADANAIVIQPSQTTTKSPEAQR